MHEFDFIRTYLAPLAGPGGLDLKDDAALLRPPAGQDLVLTKDMLVEGVHFPQGHYGGDTAERLLRTNLSDLAAKGARPIGYLLAISWPHGADPKFLAGFAAGLRDVQQAYDFQLLGGDMTATSGPMTVSATLIGVVPEGTMVKRSGAKAGDDVWVSGTLGDAMLGCHLAIGEAVRPLPNPDALWQFEEAYYRPEPRLRFRKTLRAFANSAVDISDGILADLGHLAAASEVALSLNIDSLPISNAAQSWAEDQDNPETARQSLLSFGDDYEIAFTASAADRQAIFDSARNSKLQLSLIGNVHAGRGVMCLDINGDPINFAQTGHQHNLGNSEAN